MLSIEIKRAYKSIPTGPAFTLPDFAVLTGKNGSGKSHLLEALSERQTTTVLASEVPLSNTTIIRFGQLAGQTDSQHNPRAVGENDDKAWELINRLQKQFITAKNSTPNLLEEVFLRTQERAFRELPRVKALIRRAADEGIALSQLDQSLISRFDRWHGTFDNTNLFSASLATIFNTYNVRFLDNELSNYLNEKGKSEDPGLTDEEFQKAFGPKPWDLINHILTRAGLSYRILPPTPENLRQTYTLKMVDTTKDIEITIGDLSTGEKVLMALGLAIYRTQEDAGKPDILLLDEPDAALHPEFSRLLVEVIQDVIVGSAGVPVILTTHSPSTLAMCPEEAIYEMKRDTGRPEKISRERGIRILTQGIPHLRVSTEARRQIFVESKYDVSYFERIFNALHRRAPFSYEPVFIQPHSGTSNCSDVVNIVSKLSGAGNDLVRGIIDWDLNNKTRDQVFVLGDGQRYAIENYILDPLFIALSLIKVGKKGFSDFGVQAKVGFLETTKLTAEEAQMLADSVLLSAGIQLQDSVSCELLNGWGCERPREFMEMDGHDWEKLIIATIPELNELTRGRTEDDKLKQPVLGVIEDAPEFLPVEIRKTLERLA